VASVPVQEALKALDPTVRPRVTFVEDGVREQLRTPRALATLAALLGATALGLAVVGLFGVTAFVVDLRRHEMSVRLALGATARSVIGLLLRDCLRPVVIGGALGLVLAPIGARLIRAAFFGVSPYDPVAVIGSILLLGTAAVAAVLMPARRAAGIDPVTALKAE
jgi:ABC-type antimicrobial peptide transport system permease subunit